MAKDKVPCVYKLHWKQQAHSENEDADIDLWQILPIIICIKVNSLPTNEEFKFAVMDLWSPNHVHNYVCMFRMLCMFLIMPHCCSSNNYLYFINFRC